MKTATGAAVSVVSGGARLLRGASAAVTAVGSAAAAHILAGHHAPHPVILLLALTASVPVCVALVKVRLSRWRLGAAVLFSQSVLHVLFALFPHSPASEGTAVGQSVHAGHHHHHVEHMVIADPVTLAAGHSVLPDAGMGLAHMSAGVLTYMLLRRGEVMLEALRSLLGLRPVLLSVFRPLVLTGPRTMSWPASWPVRRFSDLWPGHGPWTLRGPPAAD